MKKHLVVVEKAEHNYSAYSPDVPGVGVAGVTVEETLTLLQEALEWSLESRVEEGLSIPEPRGAQSYLAAVEMSSDGECFITHLSIAEPHHQPQS